MLELALQKDSLAAAERESSPSSSSSTSMSLKFHLITFHHRPDRTDAI